MTFFTSYLTLCTIHILLCYDSFHKRLCVQSDLLPPETASALERSLFSITLLSCLVFSLDCSHMYLYFTPPFRLFDLGYPSLLGGTKHF